MSKVEKIILFLGMIGAIYYNLQREKFLANILNFEVIIVILFSFLCISLHRYIQSYFAYKAGDINQRVEGFLTLNPFKFIDFVGIIPFIFFKFGWAKPISSDRVQRSKLTLQRLKIVLSGVILNLLLGMILALLIKPVENISLTMAAVIKLFSRINIYYGLFSLLPIPPLDGWLILMSILKRNINIAHIELYGELIIIILIGSNILPMIISYIGDYLFFIINA
jgi:Zn-dependent protease